MEDYRIERTGKPALTFRGELLAASNGRCCEGKQQNRWHDVALYRTEAGQYVLHVEYSTEWQGELDHSEAWVVGDATDVPTEFDAIQPADYVQGYPPGPAYAEKQASLLSWIDRRYRAQVGEVLAEAKEMDERA